MQLSRSPGENLEKYSLCSGTQICCHETTMRKVLTHIPSHAVTRRANAVRAPAAIDPGAVKQIKSQGWDLPLSPSS